MKDRIIVTAFAAVLTLACAKETPSVSQAPAGPEENLVEMTFEAVAEKDGTAGKSSLGEGGKTLWAETDMISVFDGEGNREFKADAAGESTVFAGEAVEASEYYALYPYSAGAECADGRFTVTVPAVQTATLNSFDPLAALMVAKGSESFEFKNVCSLYKITIPEGIEGLVKITLSGYEGEKLAGQAKISFDENGLPVASEASSETVELVAAEGSTFAAGDYYIVGLPNTFSSGLKLLFNYQDGRFQQSSARTELTVARSAIRPLGTLRQPQVVFLGATDLATDHETNAAVQWMIYNVRNSAYVPFSALDENVLSNCSVIWWHYGSTGIVSKDALLAAVPACAEESTVNLLKSRLENGTSFLLSRFATHYQAVLGVSKDGRTPNNCWGDAEPGNWKIDGTGSVFTAGGHDLNNHALFTGLTSDEDNNVWKISLVDGGYLLSNSTARFNVSEDWSEYHVKNEDGSLDVDASHNRIVETVGCELLAKDGDQNVVIWEFPETETRGGVLCIGTPFYDWHTTEGTWAWTEGSFHNNVLNMTANAIEYLK